MPITGQHTVVGYNVQIAVDSKHKLIVEHAVTNDVTDQDQLSLMARQTKDTLGVDQLDVVTDPGYYDGQEVKQCLEAGITPFMTKPQTSVNQHRGYIPKPTLSLTRTVTCIAIHKVRNSSFGLTRSKPVVTFVTTRRLTARRVRSEPNVQAIKMAGASRAGSMNTYWKPWRSG
jgi:DDE family transposase